MGLDFSILQDYIVFLQGLGMTLLISLITVYLEQLLVHLLLLFVYQK